MLGPRSAFREMRCPSTWRAEIHFRVTTGGPRIRGGEIRNLPGVLPKCSLYESELPMMPHVTVQRELLKVQVCSEMIHHHF